jgi:hypothetical protein
VAYCGPMVTRAGEGQVWWMSASVFVPVFTDLVISVRQSLSVQLCHFPTTVIIQEILSRYFLGTIFTGHHVTHILLPQVYTTLLFVSFHSLL